MTILERIQSQMLHYHTEGDYVIADNDGEAHNLDNLIDQAALADSQGFDRTGYALKFPTPERAIEVCEELSNRTTA